MRSTRALIGLSLVLAVAAFFGGRATRAPDDRERAPRERTTTESPTQVEMVEAQRQLKTERARRVAAEEALETLRAKQADTIAEKKAEEQPAEEGKVTKAVGPITDEEIEKAILAFGSNLQALIVGQDEGKAAAEELRAALMRATKEQMAGLIADFGDDSKDIGARVVLGHALAQSSNAAALEALQNHLRDPDGGLMIHRFAAHALAFSDAEGLDPFLTEVARKAEDRGVRANSSFGLARRGKEEGVDLYLAATDEAFEAKDPAALQYLGGLMLMKHDKKVNAAIRERLGTYKEEQALLVLIAIAKGKEDAGAIPALEKLAYDSQRPVSVQKAAQGAIKVLKQEG